MPPPAGSDVALREFYTARYRSMVGALVVAGASPADAEEIVQEAFVRLIPRWDKVSRYEAPEAWLRTVCFRLLSSRRRRARTRRVAHDRWSVPVEAAGPSGQRVDVLRALSQLPDGQRHVVVLHHLFDLPVEQVAAELELPTGTVKSRLARARTALGPLLRLEVDDV